MSSARKSERRLMARAKSERDGSKASERFKHAAQMASDENASIHARQVTQARTCVSSSCGPNSLDSRATPTPTPTPTPTHSSVRTYRVESVEADFVVQVKGEATHDDATEQLILRVDACLQRCSRECMAGSAWRMRHDVVARSSITSSQVKSSQVEPNRAKSSRVKSGQVGPSRAKSSQI